MRIEDLRALLNDETIYVTQHVLERMRERGIRYSAIKHAILCGEIIEDYPDDYPYPSCLVLGDGLHIVAALGECRLWIVTTYVPSSNKWEANLRTRKGE